MILPPDGETIGQRVARCRKAKGLSQEVVAHLLGKSHSWLTKVERGERQLDRISVVLEIARVLKVDATEITGRPRRQTTVNFPTPVWDEIEAEARLAGVSVGELLWRLAWVGLYFRRRIRDDQADVILEHPNGDSERLFLDPTSCALTPQGGAGPVPGPLSPDRTVTVTFPPGAPEDLVRMRVHVDGIHHGDAREATEGGWECVPATGGASIGYATFWELLTALRQLPPGRIRPGLRVNLGKDERRAALVACRERGLTAGWLEYLAGWADRGQRDRRVEVQPTDGSRA